MSARQGYAFEEELERELALLQQTGRMFASKTPDPVKITKRLSGGYITGRLACRSTLDFFGVLNGRAVMWDCKFRSARRLNFSKLQKSVYPGKPGQWGLLELAERSGALAFIAGRYLAETGQSVDVLIPFFILEAEAANGARSIRLDAANLADNRRRRGEWLDHWITRVFEEVRCDS